MQIFVMFIFGAVVLGAGAMLAPAWPTAQPRIGLAAALSLALVSGGAVFWASAFGWDTLVIDYMLFALMSGVVLGGTLSQAQTRAEAKGEVLSDADQGWPGPHDLVFFALVFLLVLLPVLALPLPLNADAAYTAQLTLATRDGQSLTTLAPFAPDVTVVRPPAFHALTAYLSQQLGLSIPDVQFAVAAVLALLCVWLAYDMGGEIRNKALGRAMALALLPAAFWLYLDAQYTGLLGLLFVLCGLLYTLRFTREGKLLDLVGAGLMLGAVAFADFALLPLLLALHLVLSLRHIMAPPANKTDRKRGSAWLLLFGVPGVALVATSPWLLSVLRDSLLGQIVEAALEPTALARYSAILGLTCVGGWVLLGLWARVPQTLQQQTRNSAYLWLAGIAIVLAVSLPLARSALVNNPSATALTQADVAALDWLRQNAPTDAVVLSYTDQVDWVLALAERITVLPATDAPPPDDASYIFVPAGGAEALIPAGFERVFQEETAVIYALQPDAGQANDEEQAP